MQLKPRPQQSSITSARASGVAKFEQQPSSKYRIPRQIYLFCKTKIVQCSLPFQSTPATPASPIHIIGLSDIQLIKTLPLIYFIPSPYYFLFKVFYLVRSRILPHDCTWLHRRTYSVIWVKRVHSHIILILSPDKSPSHHEDDDCSRRAVEPVGVGFRRKQTED